MDSENKTYKILFTGGGTGGSVTPLLAVAEELKLPPDKGGLKGGYIFNHKTPSSSPLSGGERDFEFLWLGTMFGPEREMVERAGIRFKAISGGKWRRYFSLKNLVDIFKIKIGFWQAFFIMLKWRPNLVMSAGSFISVPVIWAAWLLRAPILIHQQDATPGLANKLMAPFAKTVTVTFKKSLVDYGKKAVWTGNPVRKELGIKNYELRMKMQKYLPVVLIVGGGTGAEAINNLVMESLSRLTEFCQIIHVTGKNKSSSVILEGARNERPIESQSLAVNQGDPIAPFSRSRMTNYKVFEFLDAAQMAEALKLADVVVTRAGLGFLTELSYLEKPVIIIPIPDSHQGANAEMFKEAAIVLEQKDLTSKKFIAEIKNLIANKDLQKELGEKMGRVMKRGANQTMVKIILGLLK